MTKLLVILGLVVLLALTVFAIGRLRLALRADPAQNVIRDVAATTPPGDDEKTEPQASDDAPVLNLADVLEPIRQRNKVAALGAVVVRAGKVVASGATGVRHAGGTQPVTIQDRFHLGSDTKAMTATLVASLVADGTLSWSSTVADVFKDTVPKIDESWKSATIEQLLHNRGGAPSDLHADGLWERLWKREGTPAQQRMQLVQGVISRPAAYKAGTKFVYSNAGFAIAGAMAEQITGTSWEQLIQKRVFTPLGITTAGFGPPGLDEPQSQPWGHNPKGVAVKPGPEADNPPAIAPAGTVHMSLLDWAKFVRAHLRGHASNPLREAVLVSPELFEKMHTPIDDYAMGWGVTSRAWAKGDRPSDRGIVLTHAGSNTMWFCVAWLAPERDLAILVACNQGGPAAERAADQAVGAAMEHTK